MELRLGVSRLRPVQAFSAEPAPDLPVSAGASRGLVIFFRICYSPAMSEKQHVVSALVENRAGTLSRVSGLFSRRGFNIDSLTVGETEDPSISRMTIAVTGPDSV
ncbi:MAG: acetolactate synthase small subunit, partial [Spirochaetaceae bacterium]|nr:acetolactate synthase small subunit [Spirochaetaceae bacterium]